MSAGYRRGAAASDGRMFVGRVGSWHRGTVSSHRYMADGNSGHRAVGDRLTSRLEALGKIHSSLGCGLAGIKLVL